MTDNTTMTDTTTDATMQPVEPTGWVDVVGLLLILAGVGLGIIRFLGEDPVARSAESLTTSIALGALVATPGVLCLIANRTGRTPLLLPAAIVLALLSTLSPATLTLIIGAVALAWRWVRSPPGASRWRSAAGAALVVAGAIGAALVVAGAIGAAALLLFRTTTRTFASGNHSYMTTGWIPWSTSIAVFTVLAVTIVAACAAVPPRSVLRPGRQRSVRRFTSLRL